MKTGRSVISFESKTLARNPRRNAQKADKYAGLNKDDFAKPPRTRI
jgi:hypothetical protein